VRQAPRDGQRVGKQDDAVEGRKRRERFAFRARCDGDELKSFQGVRKFSERVPPLPSLAVLSIATVDTMMDWFTMTQTRGRASS